MNKYIISLTTEGRKARRITDLRSRLESTPDVVIIEGGRNAFTVEAPVSALPLLRALEYAEIEPHSTLDLLSGRRRATLG